MYFPLLLSSCLASDIGSEYHMITYASNKRFRLVYTGLAVARQDATARIVGKPRVHGKLNTSLYIAWLEGKLRIVYMVGDSC